MVRYKYETRTVIASLRLLLSPWYVKEDYADFKQCFVLITFMFESCKLTCKIHSDLGFQYIPILSSSPFIPRLKTNFTSDPEKQMCRAAGRPWGNQLFHHLQQNWKYMPTVYKIPALNKYSDIHTCVAQRANNRWLEPDKRSGAVTTGLQVNQQCAIWAPCPVSREWRGGGSMGEA